MRNRKQILKRHSSRHHHRPRGVTSWQQQSYRCRPYLPLVEEPLTDPELTKDQAEALRKIEAAYEPGEFYLLTGHAGSGKTYLMQRLTKNMLAKKCRIVLSAPTHKAVAVLARK